MPVMLDDVRSNLLVQARDRPGRVGVRNAYKCWRVATELIVNSDRNWSRRRRSPAKRAEAPFVDEVLQQTRVIELGFLYTFANPGRNKNCGHSDAQSIKSKLDGWIIRIALRRKVIGRYC